jgi:hypothetical protein
VRPGKTLARLFATTSAELPYAKLRFTAFGRVMFAFHALLYFATAVAIYEGQLHADDGSRSSGEGGGGTGGTSASAEEHEQQQGQEQQGQEQEQQFGAWVPLVCLGLGLVATNACLSEERSPTFFQRLSVVGIWANLLVAVGTVECRVCGTAPPLPLAFPTAFFSPLTSEVVFLVINLANAALVDTHCTVGGLAAAASNLLASPERLLSVVHGGLVVLPIFVANLGSNATTSAAADSTITTAVAEIPCAVLLLRHVLLVVLILNLVAPGAGDNSLSFGAMHLLHFFPFLRSILRDHSHSAAAAAAAAAAAGSAVGVYWPFSVPVSASLFVASAAVSRFPFVVRGERRPVTPPSKAHEVLRSGSVLGAAIFALNAAFILSALLLSGDTNTPAGEEGAASVAAAAAAAAAGGEEASVTLPTSEGGGGDDEWGSAALSQLSLFALGFSNVHAAFSSEHSHSAMALLSACALLGNVVLWTAQLGALVQTNSSHATAAAAAAAAASSSSSAATVVSYGVQGVWCHDMLTTFTSAWGLPPFETYLSMWQLSAMALLLLKLEVRFTHYEPLLRGAHLVHGAVVLLPTLGARLGLSPGASSSTGGADDPLAHSLRAATAQLPVVDVAFLVLYCLAVGGFFFGGVLDRAFTFAIPVLYSAVLGGFFGVGGISKPVGWGYGLSSTIAIWLVSLLFLRFRHLAEPRIKSA